MVEAPTFPLDERPVLRPVEVEVMPVGEGEPGLVLLRDPSDRDLPPILLSDGALEVLGLLDGERTVEAVAAALQLRGAAVAASQVRGFLEQLDAAGYLEGPRARHRLEERRAEFRARAVRPATHAGGAYPDDLDALPRLLAAGYLHADGPGALPGRRAPDAAPLRGVIAPHVDLHRGAPTYSWAYKALAEAQPAELYLVLGTCHTPVQGSFASTAKPYDTPLGAVPSDADFLERLGRLWGQDVFEGELSHAGEHSIEFQAVYLRSLGLAGEQAAPMVAILCDSLHSLVLPPYSPRDVALVSDFLGALQQTMAEDGRRITVIAAVDLAHVGPRFGDRWLADAEHMGRVAQADQEMLSLVLQPDAEAYFQQVMRDQDTRRICGLTPMYLLTELMHAETRPGQLLRYTQWIAPDQTSSVTFASAIFA
jgi:AmmeMemoRadiSam system protein B